MFPNFELHLDWCHDQVGVIGQRAPILAASTGIFQPDDVEIPDPEHMDRIVSTVKKVKNLFVEPDLFPGPAIEDFFSNDVESLDFNRKCLK